MAAILLRRLLRSGRRSLAMASGQGMMMWASGRPITALEGDRTLPARQPMATRRRRHKAPRPQKATPSLASNDPAHSKTRTYPLHRRTTRIDSQGIRRVLVRSIPRPGSPASLNTSFRLRSQAWNALPGKIPFCDSTYMSVYECCPCAPVSNADRHRPTSPSFERPSSEMSDVFIRSSSSWPST